MADLDLRAINRNLLLPPSGDIVLTFDASASTNPDLSESTISMWVQPLWMPTLEPGEALLTATADSTGASGGIIEFTFDAATLWTAVAAAGNPNIRTIIADGDLPLVSMPTTLHLHGTPRQEQTVNVTVGAANLTVVLTGYAGVFANSGEEAVSDWGDIGGTLSDQSDLQAALDAKVTSSQVDDAIAAAATGNYIEGWRAVLFESVDALGTSFATTTWDSENDRWVTNNAILSAQEAGQKIVVTTDDGLTASASGAGVFEHDGSGNYERDFTFGLYTGALLLILPALGTYAGHVIETYIAGGVALAWHSLNDHGAQIGVADDDHEQYELTTLTEVDDTATSDPLDLDGLVNGGGKVSLLSGNTSEVVLPPATQVPVGRSVWVVASDETANTATLTLSAADGETINGNASVVLPFRRSDANSGGTAGAATIFRLLRLNAEVAATEWTVEIQNHAAGIALETAGFATNLTSSDDTVQKAFETMDALTLGTEHHQLVADDFTSYADHDTLTGNGLDAFMDGDGGLIKDTNDRLWMAGFMASEQVGFVPLETGCVNDWAWDEAQAIAVSGLPAGFLGSGGPILDFGDGTGMMVLHLEGNYFQKLAAAKVTMDASGPVSVVYLGDIFTPNKDQADCISETFTAYAGSGAFLTTTDGYVHMYAIDWADGTQTIRYTVARCLIEDIETAVAADTAPTFYKYDGTGWTEDGIGGLGADLGSDGPRGDAAFMKDIDGRWYYFRNDPPSADTWNLVTAYTNDEGLTWENERTLLTSVGTEWYTVTAYSGNPDNPREMAFDPGFWLLTTASTSYDANRWTTNYIARTEVRHWVAGPVNNLDARDITRNRIPPARVASGTAEDGYAPVASGGNLVYQEIATSSYVDDAVSEVASGGGGGGDTGMSTGIIPSSTALYWVPYPISVGRSADVSISAGTQMLWKSEGMTEITLAELGVYVVATALAAGESIFIDAFAPTDLSDAGDAGMPGERLWSQELVIGESSGRIGASGLSLTRPNEVWWSILNPSGNSGSVTVESCIPVHPSALLYMSYSNCVGHLYDNGVASSPADMSSTIWDNSTVLNQRQMPMLWAVAESS